MMWFTDIARKRPLPEAESQPRITPRVVLFHTMVGGLLGTERFFRMGTGVESHFGVGGPWDGPELDGVIFQWMNTDREADANLDANRFAISIETSDNAPNRPEDIAPWSPKQLAALVRLGNRLAEHYDIPRRQVPEWDASGYGWHAMFGAPSHYTPARGKVCPGPARIHQLKTVVLPAIFAGRDPEPEDPDMAFTDEQAAQLKWIHDNLRNGHALAGTPLDNLFGNADRTHDALVVPGTTSAEEAFNLLFGRVRNIEDAVEETAAKVDAIVAALPDPAEPPPPPTP